MFDAVRNHWPEYVIEAAALGLFMISAGSFGILIFHPDSPVYAMIGSPIVRRAVMGIAMGLTAIAIIYSPPGRRSGAHMNPAVTITFARLGKIAPWDAVFYVVSQFAGGLAGLFLVWIAQRDRLTSSSVNFVVTVPGKWGVATAFAAELTISFLLMTMVLNVSNCSRLADLTGVFAGIAVALFIFVEEPFSGMSMNPARTFASDALGGIWSAWWVYFTAPVLGMILASVIYRVGPVRRVICAKLHHDERQRCIFRCGYGDRLNILD